MKETEIVNDIYLSLNSLQLEGLDDYLAEDIEVIPMYGSTPSIRGKEKVSEMLRKMLTKATNSRFEFT